MTNILHVSPYYAPAWSYGGVVRSVSGLAEAQIRAGHKVVVLTTDARDRAGRPLPSQELLGGVLVLRAHNLSRTLRDRLNVSTPAGIGAISREVIHAQDIDVVHCHEFRTVENLLTAPSTAKVGVPLVLSPHGTLPYETGRGWAKRSWDRLVGQRVAMCFDQLIALTPVEAEHAGCLWSRLGLSLDAVQIHIVPNGVNLPPAARRDEIAAFRNRWHLGNGSTAIFVGRLAARKGLGILLDAFAELAAEDPEARLLIVGPDGGQRGRIVQRSRARGVNDRVVLTGYLQGNELQNALNASDFFVLPALGEGHPMAALEALASGLPVIAPPHCGLDLIEDWGAGMVVQPETVPLAAAMRRLSAPDLRATMAEGAVALVKTHFTWRNVQRQIDAAYQAAIHRKGAEAC
jgi:glycosyltransferase involved in cell wall biosynthesis